MAKKIVNKDEEAKAKVKALLKDTSVAGLVEDFEKPNEELNVNVIKKEKSMDWLQQQLDDALNQVEALEGEIIYYKEELQKTQLNPPQKVSNVVDNGLPPNIVALFQHFERVYEKGYTQAKIAHPEGGTGVLDMFLEYFPQLQNIKRYRYRGQ